jgi:alpha-1,3-fucosyltransferase
MSVPQYFEEIGCEVTTCVVTTHRDLLESITHYDAMLFHTAVPSKELDEIPRKRNMQQVYVMSVLESPVHTKHDLKGDHEFFNLTMTYHLDSDVVWPYAVVEDKITGQVVAPSDSPQWRSVVEDFFGENLILQ